MFLDLDKKRRNSIAAIDSDGLSISYGELIEFSDEFYANIGHRSLCFILCENTVGSLAAYVACLNKKVVPLLIGDGLEEKLLNNLIKMYKPEYIFGSKNRIECFAKEEIYKKYNYSLGITGYNSPELYNDLALLLTTSGSTGSPKLVRHSYANIENNARNIADFLELNESEKPMIDLPIQYTYGLSVATSHLYAGSTLLLTDNSLMNKKFWKFFKENNATSFTGVPYSYEVLKRLRFFNMELPSLRTLSQGGGKLYKELQEEFVKYAEQTGRKFVATYGQTEGTARMAYLPSRFALKKCGSIGNAIPNGKLYLVGDDKELILKANCVGELYYEGPNVTLGYAEKPEDLCKGDEREGVLPTGDMAFFDEDGFYYIVGRKKRFLKLFGHRVSLDECEQMVKSQFEIECACTGDDTKLIIYTTDSTCLDRIKEYLINETKLYPSSIEARFIEKIPKNEAGKTLYKELKI